VRALSRVILITDMAISIDTDKTHLARAIELAKNGTGAVKPNPVVGAVVARGEQVIGEAGTSASAPPCRGQCDRGLRRGGPV